jgi:broad specificity phosphatase PhoE
MALTVLGIRHGEVHNPKGVIYAGLDGYGLSDAGRAQARAVADALRDVEVTALYSSPLDRAMQTAGYIADITGAEVVADDRLYEWRHWQQWAGMTWEELREKGGGAFERYMNDPGSVTSGESLEELADRFASWLDDVRARHADGVVIGVTHLEGLRATLLRALGRPAKELFTIDIGLSGVVRLTPDPEPMPIGLDRLPALLRIPSDRL